MVPDGRHGRQRVPGLQVCRRGRIAARVAQLDDHIRRAREHELGAHRQRLLLRVGQDVLAAGGLEHVVQEAYAAARVDASERPRLAAEHEQRLRPRALRDPSANIGELCLDARRQRVRRRVDPDARAEAADRLRDVGQPAVDVPVVGDAGALHLRTQIGLRAVEDQQIGLERQDPLDVWIEQRPHTRQLVDLRRKAIVAADGDDAIAGAHREEHLGRRRNDRDDAMSVGAHEDRGRDDDGRERERSAAHHLNRRNSSHRKNGPPMSAVTAPTGMPAGPNAVRATRSQTTRNEPPKSAAAGSTTR